MAVNVKKVRKGVEAQKTWGYDNTDSPLSYDPINSEKIDYEEWTNSYLIIDIMLMNLPLIY